MHLFRDNIYTVKFSPAFAIPGFYASRDSAVSSLYIAVNAAFASIYAVFFRHLPDTV
jgi:hypothetical protein